MLSSFSSGKGIAMSFPVYRMYVTHDSNFISYRYSIILPFIPYLIMNSELQNEILTVCDVKIS